MESIWSSPGDSMPIGWSSLDPFTTSKDFKRLLDELGITELHPKTESDTETPITTEWYSDLEWVVRYKRNSIEDVQEEVLETLGIINCVALAVPRDCTRKKPRGGPHDPKHNFYFFTNQRTLQVYCAHNDEERFNCNQLLSCQDRYDNFLRAYPNKWTPGLYEHFLQPASNATRPLLIWEIIFPSHDLDMEALSPRDANARPNPKRIDKKPKAVEKAPPARSLHKEKDHPSPPPPQVIEPRSSDRPDGAVYNTGRLLGKGGFAICYEGKLARTKEMFALKIVKSHMPQKNMAPKFQTELQIHSKMKHANIVQFHRAFSFKECTYIVLELCPNGSLMDMIKRRRYVTEPEVRFYSIQITGAIKYMHAKGIIHRDLKMGNIFLDKDMNVKIGDFGLAALLMSGKDMNSCRRTTLCGTPNYIAPEILEKGKKGHDQTVDVWALGIIIFALLTGKPPFQSTTQEEIYRKARELEYDWPKLDTSDNYIGQEAKDLVAALLQRPEDRPDPDTIVQHPFFSTGWVPQEDEMLPKFLYEAPNPSDFVSTGLRTGRVNLYARNLKKLCIKSEVGFFSPAQNIGHSTYKEVAAEEKAGLTPVVPLAEGVVYRPFEEVLREYEEQVAKGSADGLMTSVDSPPQQAESSQTIDRTAAPSTSRAVPQSFAAQQRAQNQPASSLPQRARTINERTSSQKASSSNETGSRRTVSGRRQGRAATAVQVIELPGQNPVAPSETAEARIGADLVHQLNDAQATRKAHADGSSPTQVDNCIPLQNRLSIFSPRERPALLAETRPLRVMKTLQNFNMELDRALKARSIGPTPRGGKPTPPNIVVKWVDYTNKFGLGYILSNGSVGCIFRSSTVTSSGVAKGQVPPTCIVVRNAEKHLQQRNRRNYSDRMQIIPMGAGSSPVEFYESNDEGIEVVEVAAMNFKVAAGENGEAGKLSRGRDEFDDRKREKLVIWNKFANYMTAFGRDQDYPYDDALSRATPESQENGTHSGNVVTFYQRFGDVGCWRFGDGHFQFNFPDHTKIVLSADGIWCDFYHLPLEAARDLSLNGTLPSSALDDRQHLSYPLQTLLNFMEKTPKSGKISLKYKEHDISPVIQGIPNANDFRRKIQFIKSVVNEWVKNDGLGNSDMSPEGRLRWLGHREKVNVKTPYKHVWVTVGARNHDDRRVAWFEPESPEEIVPDIEI